MDCSRANHLGDGEECNEPHSQLAGLDSQGKVPGGQSDPLPSAVAQGMGVMEVRHPLDAVGSAQEGQTGAMPGLSAAPYITLHYWHTNTATKGTPTVSSWEGNKEGWYPMQHWKEDDGRKLMEYYTHGNSQLQNPNHGRARHRWTVSSCWLAHLVCTLDWGGNLRRD